MNILDVKKLKATCLSLFLICASCTTEHYFENETESIYGFWKSDRYIIEFNKNDSKHRVYAHHSNDWHITIKDVPFNLLSETTLSLNSQSAIYSLTAKNLVIVSSSNDYYQYPFTDANPQM
jgi:hypothetical protein